MKVAWPTLPLASVPDLLPFRGLRYDPAAIGDPGAVLCPPYDVISAADREWLLASHPRNAVRLELPAPRADAAAGPAAYAKAAETLELWMGDGTLARDGQPLIYVYEQRYDLGSDGERLARSFFCALRLEEYEPRSGVRPHERTMSGPKEDRFRLLSAVRANLSPVLFLYDDGADGAESAGLLDRLTSAPPAIDTTGPGGVGQRLWLVDPASSPDATKLLELAAARPLTIADGHHRYETALRYRDTPGAPAAAEQVLALLYEARSGGLALLPWHRLVSGIPDSTGVLGAARYLFEAQSLTAAEQVLEHLRVAGEGVIGLWTRSGGALLKVDRERLDQLLPPADSETVRWLDVSLLSGTLKRMIGSGADELSAESRLAYASDAVEAIAAVDAGRADACFLLQPTPVGAVLAVAAEGGYMPAKSTFFNPKAATGLVLNPFDGGPIGESR